MYAYERGGGGRGEREDKFLNRKSKTNCFGTVQIQLSSNS